MKKLFALFFTLSLVNVMYGQVYTFTNAGATGINGPTQAQVNTAYASTTLAGNVTVTAGIQSWTVPATGSYKIEVYGANGYGFYGGKGAYMSGEFNFNTGDVLKILVGQMGLCCNSSGTNQYGGGGGSFVVDATNNPLIIAGGGGGAGTFYNNVNLASSHNPAADASITTTAKNAVGSTAGAGGTGGNGGGAGSSCGGGGGFLTDGAPAASGGFAFVNGGVGGGGTTGHALGGFGGGGGATSWNNMRGGGGGGYSGGGGAGSSTTVVQIGGGGGSYNSGTNQVNTPALGTGHGMVVITFLIPPCTPPNINVTNITTTTATGIFTQNNPTPPIGYEYAVTTSATPPASGTPTVTGTNNFSSLTPNTTYYLHARTNCSPTLTSGWATVSFTTSDLNCAVSPSNLAATNITYNSADLSWNAIGGVTGYEYIVDQNLLPPATGSGTPIAATTFNTGATLAHGTTYYLHVRTECTGPTYSSWTTLAFTTLLCDTPNVSNATNITVNSADVWWNPVPGVLGYEYSVTTNATPPAAGTFTTNLLEPVTGLTAGTTYYLHVRTNCDVNIYSPWKTYSFTTLPCSAVTPVVSALASNSATISWNSLPGAPAYEYDFGTNATPPTGAGTSTPGLFYNATGLTPNTTYYLHVRAQCGPNTFSPWSTVSFTTLTCLPPIGLSITNVTVGSAMLSWSAPNPPSSVGQGSPATASSYEYIVDQSNAVPGGAGVSIPGTVVMVTNTSAAPITTLQPDTWYYVHLRSICYPNGGISDWILDSFKTLEPCPPVQNLRTEHVWFDEIDVLWDAVPYALYYQYSIGTSSQPPTQGTNITTTSFRARGLKDNSVYYAHVRSICSDVPNSIWETTVFKTSSLSVSNVNGSGSTMEVYPNPARNVVTVHVAGADGGMIELTDATGKLVHSQAVTSPDTQVDIHALSSGIYLLKYRDEDGRQQIGKLTKE